MKKTLLLAAVLSAFVLLFTGCANSSGGGNSDSGKEKEKTNDQDTTGDSGDVDAPGDTDNPEGEGDEDDESSDNGLTFTSTPLRKTGVKKTFNGKEIEVVQFGDWPQSEKANNINIDESKSVTIGAYTYYLGDDDEWYWKTEDSFTSFSGQVTVKYYKVEPINWYVLTNDYNGSGNSLLISKVLTEYRFSDYGNSDRTIDGKTIKPCDYEYSLLRAYLNGLDYERAGDRQEPGIYGETYELKNLGFLQTAFDSDGQTKIQTTDVVNDLANSVEAYITEPVENSAVREHTVQDKIFILSKKEASTTAYGFKDHVRDYLTGTTNENDELIMAIGDNWWLRSPHSNATLWGAGTTSEAIGSLRHGYEAKAVVGVAPVLCVKTSDLGALPEPELDDPNSQDNPETNVPSYKVLTNYKSTFGANKTYVSFGVYPQSEKADNVTIPEGAESKQQGSMTCFKGSDGEWYVKGGEKYFKVEPIKWCILTSDYKGTGKKLLLAENILVNCNYYEGYLLDNIPEACRSNKNTEEPAYPNSYWDSTLRAFLNGDEYYVRNDSESINADKQITKYKNQGFMYAAFNEADIKGIVRHYADKIFTLSLNELTDYIDTNDHRKRSVTDFAKNNGTVADGEYGKWWTRTVLQVPKNDGSNTTNNTDYVLIVTPDGVVKNTDDTIPEDNVAPAANWKQVTSNGSSYYKFVGTDIGVVPALIVD